MGEWYIEASLIIDGCLLESRDFTCEHCFDEWFKEIRKQGLNNLDCIFEVYRMEHDHSIRYVGCECIQYLTDHRPYWRNLRSSEDDDE